MQNFDHAVSQLRAAGFILDRDVIVDTARPQRWRVDGEDRERRGWSWLRTWTSKAGNVFVVGKFGVWHGADDGRQDIQLPPRDDGQPAISDEDKARIREANKARRQALDKLRKAEEKQAAIWAGVVWGLAEPAPADHDYLTRKQIDAGGVRHLASLDGIDLPSIDESNKWRLQQAVGALVVPMHNAAGAVAGLQFIYGRAHPRKAKIKRDKEFWPAGMGMGGTFGLLGPLPRSTLLLICEGYATAASLRQATGYSVAYAFSANNLAKAGKDIRRKYAGVRLLFCADDDYQTKGNPGCAAAAAATAEIENAAWCKPDFSDDAGADLRDGKKLTDFNDLAVLTGVPLTLADQVNAAIQAAGWHDAAAGAMSEGGGEAGDMPAQLSVDEAALRYWGTYGFGGKVFFDEAERRLVHRDDVLNLLPARGWDALKSHPKWRVARDTEVGFDPTEKDPAIKCNLFAGWPTEPVPGECAELLGLLEYLCSNEKNGIGLFEWVQKWLAYPLQNRGAKMHSAIVCHGPQGTGKSRFFEAYAKIFGDYARVLGQEALEDKFNADWAERKLFIIADEVLARSEMFHVKNRLKGFITGDTIRVNPKNVAAHNERNHMNMVFLSNEGMPLALEEDDRRHCVMYTPAKLDATYFERVNAEIDEGGIPALHDYLLNLDLGDFKPWTLPPMTQAKADLIHLGRSSEERFLVDWQALDIEGDDGEPLPFCPCLGSTLYRAYSRWCDNHGERRRAAKDLIGRLNKRHNWTAGQTVKTHPSLARGAEGVYKSRKMVVMPNEEIEAAYETAPNKVRDKVLRREDETKARWLTRCFFYFERAMGLDA